MTRTGQLTIKNSAQLFVVLGLIFSVIGCATRMPDMGNRSDGRFEVPDYVRNLPKSRTGNMAQYTVFGKQYRVMDSAANFTQTGTASWYGKKFHGRKTSSGEIYDMYAMTAAHKHLPIPTFVRVTNLENSKSIVVKVNDRGPFVGTRIIDLSYAAAQALDMAEQGVAQVTVHALSTHLVEENSDSNQTVAQLIEDGNNTSQTVAPAIVKPAIAAVPLVAPLQMSQALNSDSANVAGQSSAAVKVVSEPAESGVVIDASEDGFVELTDIALGPVINEPAALQSLGRSSVVQMSDGNVVGNRRAVSDKNYFIQLGAFSHAPNAEALVEQVAAQVGLPAYVEQDAKRVMYRVKMGPFTQGALLDNTLSELADLGIDGYTLQAASR